LLYGKFRAAFAGFHQKTLVASSFSGPERFAMLSRIKHFFAELAVSEDGPTAVEYAVMLALIIVVCIGAITILGQNANTTFTSVGNSIGSASS
jgi:pilus assembly protein Flp/PilA